MTRIAIVDRNKCTRDKCGYVCIKVCPEIRMGTECITKDPEAFPVIDENLCTGCGICPKKCPAGAITIINLPSELDMPLHSYGINSFRVYGKLSFNLDKNKVVAFIGKNGIGKTTIMNVMSNTIVPNFGKLEAEPDRKEVLSMLGIDSQNYFRMLYAGRLNIAYKPQAIESMRKRYEERTAGELLSAALPGTDSYALAHEFGIEDILDRKIGVLSGGELQKLAITACLGKEADVYYLDEPCTYLDISERLKLALMLRQKGEQNSVFLVEHDLAILDYASDYCSVFFGEEQAYGIISSVKNIGAGINEYLDGFLKAENMRFRSTGIDFRAFSEKEVKDATLLHIPALEKNYDGFEFSSDQCNIRKNETVGIVGRNALGKTLFLKMIASLETPDNCEFKPEIRVAYKPQYVEPEEGTVGEVLASAEDQNAIQLLKPLFRLDKLWDSQIASLSGGELQKLAIAKTLGQQAELYVFDEPSAFLDIESRLSFSTVISRMRQVKESAFIIVEHDIAMIELLANRVMPFSGKSGSTGKAHGVLEKYQGLNLFLKDTGITIRKDKATGRPKINKPQSVLDREQKSSGDYYS